MRARTRTGGRGPVVGAASIPTICLPARPTGRRSEEPETRRPAVAPDFPPAGAPAGAALVVAVDADAGDRSNPAELRDEPTGGERPDVGVVPARAAAAVIDDEGAARAVGVAIAGALQCVPQPA